MASSKGMITPFVGVLICINTMIGAGLFINPNPLTRIAGPYGFLGYFFGALLMLPLILSIGTLAKLHPVSGGFYAYSKSYIGEWAGFLSSWSYFLGKTTTVAVLIHKFVQFFQVYIPFLNNFSTVVLDYFLIFFLIGLNLVGAHVGGRVQYVFSTLKLIPIFFVFVLGFLNFNVSFFKFEEASFVNVFFVIPVCIFALVGFEIICAVGHMIQDPERNIRRVILIAFIFVACVNMLFQLLVFGTLGQFLVSVNVPILAFAQKVIPTFEILGRILNGAVYAAILGACFSILTANCWNLYKLAKNDHFPFKDFFIRVSAKNVPWVTLILEGLIACLILAITSDQVPLQNVSVFSQLVAMMLNAVAAYYAVKLVDGTKLNGWIPLFGICTASYILIIALFNIVKSGVSFSFLSIFLVGILAAILKTAVSKRSLKASVNKRVDL